jgi:hypothetical protein
MGGGETVRSEKKAAFRLVAIGDVGLTAYSTARGWARRVSEEAEGLIIVPHPCHSSEIDPSRYLHYYCNTMAPKCVMRYI